MQITLQLINPLTFTTRSIEANYVFSWSFLNIWMYKYIFCKIWFQIIIKSLIIFMYTYIKYYIEQFGLSQYFHYYVCFNYIILIIIIVIIYKYIYIYIYIYIYHCKLLLYSILYWLYVWKITLISIMLFILFTFAIWSK